MEYYVEIKKVGIRVYNCTFIQMLSELALECIKNEENNISEYFGR
jgi:hypothetical protein